LRIPLISGWLEGISRWWNSIGVYPRYYGTVFDRVSSVIWKEIYWIPPKKVLGIKESMHLEGDLGLDDYAISNLFWKLKQEFSTLERPIEIDKKKEFTIRTIKDIVLWLKSLGVTDTERPKP